MEISPSEITKIHKNPIQTFNQSMKAKITKDDYERKLKKIFCQYLKQILKGDPELLDQQMTKLPQSPKKRGVKRPYLDADFEVRANEFVSRAKKDPEWAESVILKLIEKLRNRAELQIGDANRIETSYVKNMIAPLQKLLDVNKVTLAWKLIRSTFPEKQSLDDSREYTYEEIRKLLSHARVMDRVIILLAASSGIRAGAFTFKWKHITPIYLYQKKFLWEDQDVTESVSKDGIVVAAMIRVYANSGYEYFAFLTPECWNAILAYKSSWIREMKKEPQPDDPFFKKSGPFVRELSDMGIRKRVERILAQAGLRQPLPKGCHRHEVPIFNGFRRFFNKANKKSLSKNSVLASLILKENMMGHVGLISLDQNYFKAHLPELIDEYLPAVPYLTISNEERQKIKIEQLERENPTDQSLLKMVKVLSKKQQISDFRLRKVLEAFENVAKNNKSIIVHWDKSQPFHYPDDEELKN